MTTTNELPARLEELRRKHGAPADVNVRDVKPISGGYSLLPLAESGTGPTAGRRALQIVNDDGTMAPRSQLTTFAGRHNLLTISIGQLIAFRRRHEPLA